MPTQPYHVNGKRVPSVTTILSQYKDPGALMYWSWNISNEVLKESLHVLSVVNRNISTGMDRDAFVRVSQVMQKFLRSNPLERADYKKQAAKAASAGTLAHALVDLWIHADEVERGNISRKSVRQISSEHGFDLEISQKAYTAFQAFLKWSKVNHFEVEETELSLTSEEHNYGGTIDCVCWLNNQLTILDWKTSKSLYFEYVLQIAAYGLLWNENYTPDVQAYHLLRFDKETGDFSHHEFADVTEASRMFLLFRECYELQKAVSSQM
jgi:hypothetical protein